LYKRLFDGGSGDPDAARAAANVDICDLHGGRNAEPLGNRVRAREALLR
jgi:hypothetical protein